MLQLRQCRLRILGTFLGRVIRSCFAVLLCFRKLHEIYTIVKILCAHVFSYVPRILVEKAFFVAFDSECNIVSIIISIFRIYRLQILQRKRELAISFFEHLASKTLLVKAKKMMALPTKSQRSSMLLHFLSSTPNLEAARIKSDFQISRLFLSSSITKID